MDDNPLYQSIFPILQEEESRIISIAGTSVLVSHRELPFLVTAAHVLRENGQRYPLYLSLKNENVFLSGPAHVTPAPLDPDGDDLDIAFFDLRLNYGLANSLVGHHMISLEDPTPEQEPISARQHFFVFGFPWRKALHNKENRTMAIKPLRYFTDLDNRNMIYAKYKRPKTNHLIVRYNRKQTIDQARQKVTAPKPAGTSGGPLFRVLVDDQDVARMFILEGILTEWQGNEVMIATRKSALRDFIDSRY